MSEINEKSTFGVEGINDSSIKYNTAQEALKSIMSEVTPPQKPFEEIFSNTDKYAAKLTEKMAAMDDIKEKDRKLIEAMVLVDKDIFAESVKNIIGENIVEVEKIVKYVNLANDCYIDPKKAIEAIIIEIEAIKEKLANYLVENIPLSKRKTDAEDMRKLMDELDITKLLPKKEKVEIKTKWYHKILQKIKSLFK